jgi:hypothetical protein
MARKLPYNTDVEQIVLGSILAENAVYHRVVPFLRPDDFGNALHGRIFALLGRLISEGRPAHPAIVKDVLVDDGTLQSLEVNGYLARLALAGVVTHPEDYARHVHDLAARRAIIAACEDTLDDASRFDIERSAGKIIEEHMARLAHANGVGAAAAETASRLRPLSLAEFLELELPPRGMMLAPWLPEKGLAMVYAKRGVGKTHFALTGGYAVACSGSYLGFEAPRPRRVLYLDGEMPAKTMQSRLAAIVAGFDPRPPESTFFRLLSADLIDGGLPDLGTTEGQAEVDAAIGDAELVIVDNLSALLRSGKENEAESWLLIQSWALAHRRAGRSILFVHHAGKGGQQRGTSRREDLLDTVITLRWPEDYQAEQGARFEVYFEKARGVFGDDARAFEARYEERDGAALWTRTEIADAELMRVVAALHDGMSIRGTAEELGLSKGQVERLKKRAIEQGLLNA